MADGVLSSSEEILANVEADLLNIKFFNADPGREDQRLKSLYPFPPDSLLGISCHSHKFPRSVENAGIPSDVLNPHDQPVLMDFKFVMQSLQKTIAIEHAKKVREGKESVNMNGVLRDKYSDDSYYFPDRILNSGLSKKDFTAPFLIDVKLINQECARNKENERKRVPLLREPESSSSPDESRKRKDISTDESLVCSPTLFALLEQAPGSKRLRVSESRIGGTPVQQRAPVVTGDAVRKNQQSILAKTLTSSVSMSLLRPSLLPGTNQSSSSSAPASSQLIFKNGNIIPASTNKTVTQTSARPSISIKPRPEPVTYVSIRPKLPISVTTPDNSPCKGTGHMERDQDDDFSPKIINTQGSVIFNKAGITSAEPSTVQTNGMGSVSPDDGTRNKSPKSNNTNLLRIQQSRKLFENSSRLSSNVNSNTRAKAATVRGSGFLGCKSCGKTFPSNCDNLFRSHMIIKHHLELTDKDILDAKIQVTSWYKCKKCYLMVLNNLEDHNKKCSPETPFESSFDAIQVLTDDVPKLQCGLCPEALESRVLLRAHLTDEHPDICNKVLLDPFFRCGVCLLLFTETSALIQHVTTCTELTPSLDTAQELAQKNLHCDICSKKHSKIRETLFCYQVKDLLRCVLCLHVSITRNDFFNHLKVHHNRRSVGLKCPFCSDDVEKPTRHAFDHFIDHHYNVALKRAGEAALIRGRIQLQANAQATRNGPFSGHKVGMTNINSIGSHNTYSNNNLNNSRIMPRLTRPMLPQKKLVPALRLKTYGQGSPSNSGQTVGIQPAPPATASGTILNSPPTIRVPLSQMPQMLKMTSAQSLSVSSSVQVLDSQRYPPGTVLATRPIFINSKGGLPQIPLPGRGQFLTVVPATSALQATLGNTVTTMAVDPRDAAAEDSILGM